MNGMHQSRDWRHLLDKGKSGLSFNFRFEADKPYVT